MRGVFDELNAAIRAKIGRNCGHFTRQCQIIRTPNYQSWRATNAIYSCLDFFLDSHDRGPIIIYGWSKCGLFGIGVFERLNHRFRKILRVFNIGKKQTQKFQISWATKNFRQKWALKEENVPRFQNLAKFRLQNSAKSFRMWSITDDELVNQIRVSHCYLLGHDSAPIVRYQRATRKA